MKINVELYGRLAEKYGGEFAFDVLTPREAIRALCSQFRNFEVDFRSEAHHVFRIFKDHRRLIANETGAAFPLVKGEKIVIVPAVAGAAAGAFILFTFAFSYVIGKTFAPVVQPIDYPTEPPTSPSFLFNGPTNISAQGVCVPLAYGRVRVGSVVVSESVNAVLVPPEAVDGTKVFAIWKGTVDTLRLVDVISEGEIGGLVDGERSVYLNETPLAGAITVYSSSDIEVLAGDIYELPSGHGQTYYEDQIIKAEGFTNSENNGVKTVATFSGDRITVRETLVVEAPGAAVTITAYEYNFENVVWSERVGTATQDHVAGFPQTEQTIAVGAAVDPGTPVVRTVTGAELDALLVTVKFPQGLYRIPDWGGYNPMWTRILIEIKPNGGSYETAINSQVWGNVASPLKIDYRLELPAGGSPWDVRVSRVSWTPTEAQFWEDDTEWDSYTTVIDAKLTYPDTGLIALSLNARDFAGRTPRRAYEIDGLKIQIPDNYDPVARTYTGIWGGAFTTAWSNNPAWVLYDLLTKKRYGLGNFIDAARVDKWELYSIAQSCDERVNNGFGFSSDDIEVLAGNIYELPTGHEQNYEINDVILAQGFANAANNGLKTVTGFSGDQITVSETLAIEAPGASASISHTEPRYTFNGVFGKRDVVYKTLTAMISNFRGMVFWGADGTVSFSQERDDKTPVKLVSPSNAIDGLLTYSGAELSERHSVALVSWNDPENNYETAVEVVEDAELIAELGWKPIDVAAFGCTSRGQAHRYGRYELVTERYETERLTYQASFDHADLRPGDIISVADPAYAGVRFGGRVAARTLNSITIDSAIELEVGESYEISAILPDGAIETRDITNGSGAGQTVMNLASALSALPVLGSLWIINATNVSPREFTVVSVRETEKNIFEIGAVFRLPNKFAVIEDDFFIEDNSYSIFEPGIGELPIVSDITVREYTYLDGGSVLSGARITWNPPTDPKETARIAFYDFQYRHPDSDGYLPYSTTEEPGTDLLNVQAGTYGLRVRTLSAAGAAGAWVTVEVNILGLAGPPADVENFAIQVTGTTALLSWDSVPDLDLSHYRLKFSSAVTGANWESAVDIALNVTGNQISLPARVGTYLIKAVDVYGTESANAALIVSQIAGLLNFNVVEVLDEAPDYLGTHVDTFAFGSQLQLGDGLVMADWVTLASVSALVDGAVPEGEYYFAANPFDLGAVFTSRLTATFGVTGYDRATMLPAPPEEWDVILQLRTTDDDPAGSPTWSAWQDFLVGDYTARGFEFRIKLFSFADDVTPLVEDLSVTVDMPDRVVGDADILCPAVGLTVIYDPAFKARPALAVDSQDMDTGDYKTITLQDEAGFFVQFFDSSDTPISRTFDYLAKGYGA